MHGFRRCSLFGIGRKVYWAGGEQVGGPSVIHPIYLAILTKRRFPAKSPVQLSVCASSSWKLLASYKSLPQWLHV